MSSLLGTLTDFVNTTRLQFLVGLLFVFTERRPHVLMQIKYFQRSMVLYRGFFAISVEVYRTAKSVGELNRNRTAVFSLHCGNKVRIGIMSIRERQK
jgi:hypothetical protein